MSKYKKNAVSLKYEDGKSAPIITASGSGFIAEKMIEIANKNSIPVYEDDSLVTILRQLEISQEIPSELYQTIVDIYLYFLEFRKLNNS